MYVHKRAYSAQKMGKIAQEEFEFGVWELNDPVEKNSKRFWAQSLTSLKADLSITT